MSLFLADRSSRPCLAHALPGGKFGHRCQLLITVKVTMKFLVAFCLLQALAVALAQAPAAPSEEELQQAVLAGVESLKALAQQNLESCQALLTAVESGDLDQAKQAYERSRPEYEQIEILANAFPDIDSDIDARPYAFPTGEADLTAPSEAESGAVFLGKHRVEAYLYRDANTSAAVPYAQRLVNTSQELIDALANSSNFSPESTFRGLIAQGIEVSGKKVASEEETWSDLSILIFYNNFLGMSILYDPFRPILERVNETTAAAVDEAFAAANSSTAPYVTITGDAITYTPYSTVSVPDRAPIQSAGYSLGDALAQAAEDLGINVEEAEEEEECTPTVQTADISAASPEIQNGLNYLRGLLPAQQEYGANLTAAIEAGDLEAAKTAYTRSRPFYEQIEVLAASFEDIDGAIDAREYAWPLGENDPDFIGAHHIEALLFRDSDVGPQTLELSRGLQESYTQLDAVFETSGSDDEVFNPSSNFGGIIGLATEIVSKKISSEEEKYSDLSFLIFYNNYKGIYSQALPFFTEAAAAQRTQLEEALQAAVACLPVETNDEFLSLGVADDAAFTDNLANANYGAYSSATPEQRACINREGYRVRAALLEAAAVLNVIDDCSDFYPEVEEIRSSLGLAAAPAAAPEEAESGDGGDGGASSQAGAEAPNSADAAADGDGAAAAGR